MKRSLLWTLDTVIAVAVATVGACVAMRGLLLGEQPKPRRDPFTGRPESRPN